MREVFTNTFEMRDHLKTRAICAEVYPGPRIMRTQVLDVVVPIVAMLGNLFLLFAVL